VRITRASLRDFRNCERGEVVLGSGLSVVCGPNGAGKTNLLEAIYFGCTARSPRTANERELVRHGAGLTRVELETEGDHDRHLLEVGFEPGEPKRIRVDGAPVDGLADSPARPLVSVFMPDRLELVKGAPALRRSHIDHLVEALWPARGDTRRAYGRALAHRNALLARVRHEPTRGDLLEPWDSELARIGVQLASDRREALDRLRPLFAGCAEDLGLAEAQVAYRPRSPATDAAELRAELRSRRAEDVERGFTTHGPHRDEVAFVHEGRLLRSFGSQGQQRLALLALLFAEHDLLARERARPPLMLLDDVMSELDGPRRERLMALVAAGGQTIVTTTDLDHVPGAAEGHTAVIEVDDGRLALGAVPA
jgi:DNA replication and repair protein RecF